MKYALYITMCNGAKIDVLMEPCEKIVTRVELTEEQVSKIRPTSWHGYSSGGGRGQYDDFISSVVLQMEE